MISWRKLWILASHTAIGAALASGCNAILLNEPGRLLGGDAGDDAAPLGDGSVSSGSSGGLHDGSIADASSDANDAGTTGPTIPTSADAGWALALGSSLSMWLDSDRGMTTGPCGGDTCVTRWADQSGNGNDAIADYAAAIPPRLSSALYQGHQALRFDGNATSLLVADSTSMALNGGYTLVAVASESRAFHEGALYAKTSSIYPFVGVALWGSYVSGLPHGTGAVQVDMNQFLTSNLSGLDDGTLRMFASTFDSQTVRLFVDDTPPGDLRVSLSAALGAPGAFAFIGGNPGGGQVFAGDIVELLLVSRSLDSTEWAAMRAYLHAKYGI
jgi:hypothetical protein